jgi:hypothetical protein
MTFARFGRGALLLAGALIATGAPAAGQTQQADRTTPPDAGDASAAQSPAPPGGRVALIGLGHHSPKGVGQQAQQSPPHAQQNGRSVEVRPYHAPPGQQ